jgi:hypothetical protein
MVGVDSKRSVNEVRRIGGERVSETRTYLSSSRKPFPKVAELDLGRQCIGAEPAQTVRSPNALGRALAIRCLGDLDVEIDAEVGRDVAGEDLVP